MSVINIYIMLAYCKCSIALCVSLFVHLFYKKINFTYLDLCNLLTFVVPGATGVSGDRGEAGFTGPSGRKGQSGHTGPMGSTGFHGATGPAGHVGASGSAGKNGQTGSTGFIGPTGSTGVTGPGGHKGDIGGTGHTGLGQTGTYDDGRLSSRSVSTL